MSFEVQSATTDSSQAATQSSTRQARRRSKKSESQTPGRWQLALGILFAVVIVGVIRDKLAAGLLTSLLLFAGLLCFERSRGSRFTSGLRIAGSLLGCMGVGALLDVLVWPIGFTAFGLFAGFVLAYLLEC